MPVFSVVHSRSLVPSLCYNYVHLESVNEQLPTVSMKQVLCQHIE